MVHPSELLRTNSNEARSFSAPRIEYNLDCGLTHLPILNRCCNLEKFATPRVFLVFLSLVGFLQGVTLTYFRETSNIWGNHYNVPQEYIGWLIYVNEVFVGLIGLVTAHYGNKTNRISWIGGLTIFHAISSGLLLVPEIYRKGYLNETVKKDPDLCLQATSKPSDVELNYVAVAVLCTFQIVFAMVTVSFISHGITYLDDNSTSKSTSQYIGIALAFREVGKQGGLYFSWIPNYLKNRVFVSPVWLSIASLTFITGILISMFPRAMFSTLVKTLSASLVDIVSGHTTAIPKPKIDGFFKILVRLLKNKILMINIFSAVLLQAGLINFNIFESFFKQSRFQISHFNDSSYTQFTTNILKQPLVAICLLAVGFVVAKTRPSLEKLVGWNIAVIVLVIVFFGSTAFLKCEPNTQYDEMMSRCRPCQCDNMEYHPVCANSRTYFSPCHAGCKNVSISSRKTYSNCVCTGYKEATEGPCDEETCDMYYALSQVNSVFTTAMLSTTFVTNIIINMRSVIVADKPSALGLEATLTALITYLPVKAIYGAIAEQNCIVPRNETRNCKLYSKNLATYLAFCTIGFLIAALIFEIVAYILLKCNPSDKNDEQDEDSEVELEPINRSEVRPVASTEQVDAAVTNRKSNSITDSLLEMENVGDDHDSVDSSPFLDHSHTRVNQNRVIESDF